MVRFCRSKVKGQGHALVQCGGIHVDAGASTSIFYGLFQYHIYKQFDEIGRDLMKIRGATGPNSCLVLVAFYGRRRTMSLGPMGPYATSLRQQDTPDNQRVCWVVQLYRMPVAKRRRHKHSHIMPCSSIQGVPKNLSTFLFFE